MNDRVPPTVHCSDLWHSLFENLALSSFSGLECHTHSQGCPTSTADGCAPENAASKGSLFSTAQWLRLFPDLRGSAEYHVSNLSFQYLLPLVYFGGRIFQRQQRSRCAPALARRRRGTCWVRNPSCTAAQNHAGSGWWRVAIRPLGTRGSDCNNQIPFLDGTQQLLATFS